jgi:hypothetical protein
MTKSELIDILSSEVPSLRRMSPQEIETTVDSIIEYLASSPPIEPETEDDLETLEEAPIIIKPISTRRIKAKIVRREDPHKFIPPDEDDFLIDLD